MFNSYNEKSCLMECRIKYAVNVTGCLPWDYNLPPGIEVIENCLSE